VPTLEEAAAGCHRYSSRVVLLTGAGAGIIGWPGQVCPVSAA